MKTKKVIVENYNPIWVEAFQNIKSEIEPILKDLVISIEHVGSTSVPGLKSKPIIDIDIVIHSLDDFNEVKLRLGTIGYIHEGNQGLEGREAFKYLNKSHLMKHHLYVCQKVNLHFKRHITLRDHLRTHPIDVNIYGDLKEALAKAYPNDIDQYIEGKSDFIMSIYKQYHLN